MNRARSLALLTLVAALAPACGHRGPPVPPLRHTPPMLGLFRLAQRGDVLEVSCTAPRASVDGVAFDSVDIEIFWGEGLVDLEKEGSRRTVQALPGTSIVETLPLPAPGTLVRAAARAVVGRNEGQRTLILALEAQPPLTPPDELSALLLEKGVALSWQGPLPEPVAPPDLGPAGGAPLPFSDFFSQERPDREAVGEELQESPGERPREAPGKARPVGDEAPGVRGRSPLGRSAPAEEGMPPDELLLRTHGFRVYRRAPSGTFGTPLNREPLEERELTDRMAPVGATACYVVRAAASVEPLIESAPSNEVCLEVRDITPPAPPTGLAVVPREGGLDVVWSPPPALDVGGYRIYRAAGGEDAVVVAEVKAGETTWHDARVDAGVLYRYTITALDRAGNESPPSGSVEGRPD